MLTNNGKTVQLGFQTVLISSMKIKMKNVAYVDRKW